MHKRAPMKTMTLEQIEAVLRIMQAWPDDSVIRVRKLKEYLVPFRTSLEAKGVVPEYLAYVLEFRALSGHKQRNERLLDLLDNHDSR